VLPYPAYLRVYEPLTAFPEPDRSTWARYADSLDRPRRTTALAVEHGAAIHRLLASPPVVAPARESTDAYVRRTSDRTFICPWQTRLRSWAAFSAFRTTLSAAVAESFVPRIAADQAEADFERWKGRGDTLRRHILSSTWRVPLAWFVPFSAGERCLVLGAPPAEPKSGSQVGTQGVDRRPGDLPGPGPGGRPGPVGGPTTTAPPRTLMYVTSMGLARRRLAAAIPALRGASGDRGLGIGDGPRVGDGFGVGGVATLGRWLEGFHPDALVELDYGGLVHLLTDEALRADESVAEVAAVLEGIVRDRVVARAMYERLRTRWRSVQALSNAN
jgi:hypothetical protein